jgi:hypothetical protein
MSLLVVPQPEHAFISYAREDHEFVDLLDSDLKEASIETWRDKSNMRTDDRITDTVSDAVAISYAMIVILSESSKGSNWVKDEVALAQSKGVGLVIIKIDETRPEELSIKLIERHYIEFAHAVNLSGPRYTREYRSLLEQVKGELEAKRREITELPKTVAQVEALIRGKGAGYERKIMDLVRGADLRLRHAAIIGIGQLKLEVGFPYLLEIVNPDNPDPNPDIRAAAVKSLGLIGKKGASESLVALIDDKRRDKDRIVRQVVAIALGKLNVLDGINALIDLARNDAIKDVRESATKSLCRLRTVANEAQKGTIDFALENMDVDCAKYPWSDA